MTPEAIGYVLVAVAIGVSLVALRTPFGLMKLGAGVAWLACFVYFLDVMGQGEPYQVVFIMALFAVIVSFFLLQTGRDVERTRTDLDGFQVKSNSFRFGFRDKDSIPTRPSAMTTQEYEDKMRRALEPRARGSRR